MADEEKKEAKQEVTAEPKKKNMIGSIILVLIFLGAQVGIAFFLVDKLKVKDENKENLKKENARKEQEDKDRRYSGQGLETPISITVNIANTDGKGFLKLGINFEWNGDKYPEMQTHLESRMARIKHIIMDESSALPLGELQSAEGKKGLLRRIRQRINSILPKDGGEIKRIYFDEYLLQV